MTKDGEDLAVQRLNALKCLRVKNLKNYLILI
jgi:hypothetical protein